MLQFEPYLLMKLKLTLRIILTLVGLISPFLNASASTFVGSVVFDVDSSFVHTFAINDEYTKHYKLSSGKILVQSTLNSIEHFENLISQYKRTSGVTKLDSYLLKEETNWSYHAKKHRLKDKERTFVKIQRLYIVNGSRSEISQLMLRYKAAFTKNNIQRDVMVYSGVVGNNLPFIEIVRMARTKEDDVAYEDEVNSLFGEALLRELSAEFGQYIRQGDAAMEGTVL